MSNWLRLTLITMTVGGGFAGVALTAQVLFSEQVSGPVLMGMCLVFTLLYLFVLISGLVFVQNPRRVMPTVVALALQIPVISSPLVAYRFGAGLHGGAGLGELGPFGWLRLGCDWQLNLLQPLPWGVGINLVAVLMLIVLTCSTARLK